MKYNSCVVRDFVRELATLRRYNCCILFEGNLSCDSINDLDVFNLWLDL
jgi:hypothetical protein